jgi:hypothetical protein
MNRRALVRNVILGALVTGLAPLIGAGVDSATAAGSPAALCQSTFGEGGPAGGSVVGEGPSGDPMGTTIGWDPVDWPDGLSEIVTCVSVGGRALPALTTSRPTPGNDGSLVISLTLPPGEPGSLVCEQSVLVGAGDAAGGHRTTSPVCFKLRGGESPVGAGGLLAGGPVSPFPAPPTPPARASFEAARGPVGPVARRALPAPTPSAAPAASPSVAPSVKTGRSAAAATPAATAATPAATTPAGAPPAALARTGLDNHIPLVGAGGFLALGGAAIIFGTPRRRRPCRLSA